MKCLMIFLVVIASVQGQLFSAFSSLASGIRALNSFSSLPTSNSYYNRSPNVGGLSSPNRFLGSSNNLYAPGLVIGEGQGGPGSKKNLYAPGFVIEDGQGGPGATKNIYAPGLVIEDGTGGPGSPKNLYAPGLVIENGPGGSKNVYGPGFVIENGKVYGQIPQQYLSAVYGPQQKSGIPQSNLGFSTNAVGGRPQNYGQNVRNPIPVQPYVQYPGIKNSLNGQNSNLKEITNQYGGLSNPLAFLFGR